MASIGNDQFIPGSIPDLHRLARTKGDARTVGRPGQPIDVIVIPTVSDDQLIPGNIPDLYEEPRTKGNVRTVGRPRERTY